MNLFTAISNLPEIITPNDSADFLDTPTLAFKINEVRINFSFAVILLHFS